MSVIALISTVTSGLSVIRPQSPHAPNAACNCLQLDPKNLISYLKKTDVFSDAATEGMRVLKVRRTISPIAGNRL
jgi:N-dimethylarginine dimethylaminohydrolase